MTDVLYVHRASVYYQVAIQIQIKAFVIKLSVLIKNSALLAFIKDLGDLIFNFKVLALIAVQK